MKNTIKLSGIELEIIDRYTYSDSLLVRRKSTNEYFILQYSAPGEYVITDNFNSDRNSAIKEFNSLKESLLV